MLLEETIEGLDIGHRYKNALYRNDIRTIGRLIRYSALELLAMNNLGPKGVNEIAMALKRHGLKLKDEGVIEAGRYALCVKRVSYSTKLIEVEVDATIGIEELKDLGIEKAKDLEFKDRYSEYEVEYILQGDKIIN